MTRKQWNELSPLTRRLVMVGGAVAGALKLAALIDLARRPPQQVRGSKKVWAAAILLINSMGAVPLAYFTHGRRAQGLSARSREGDPPHAFLRPNGRSGAPPASRH